DARERMARANEQLGTPEQAPEAAAAMRQAARDLDRAARQLNRNTQDTPTRSGQPASRPNEGGPRGGGTPDPVVGGPDLGLHAGKPWGELPGEVRTRLL